MYLLSTIHLYSARAFPLSSRPSITVRTEILNDHRNGATIGPTEIFHSCVKQNNRLARGFSCIERYQVRVAPPCGRRHPPSVPHRFGSDSWLVSTMDDATGLAEALLGLDGFVVLAVDETPSEVIVTVETTADFVGCPNCGVRAVAKDRIRVEIRDLPCFGRPARLVWLKRRWRCDRPGAARRGPRAQST